MVLVFLISNFFINKNSQGRKLSAKKKYILVVIQLYINFVFLKTSSHFRLLLVLFTVSMPLLNGMKIVELYLAVNQHVKTFIFSNLFLFTAKAQIHALKLFVRMRWIVNCNLNTKILKYTKPLIK